MIHIVKAHIFLCSENVPDGESVTLRDGIASVVFGGVSEQGQMTVYMYLVISVKNVVRQKAPQIAEYGITGIRMPPKIVVCDILMKDFAEGGSVVT